MAGLAENYNGFLQDIRQTAVSAGRDPGEILLLAVSKTFPKEDIAVISAKTVSLNCRKKRLRFRGISAGILSVSCSQIRCGRWFCWQM